MYATHRTGYVLHRKKEFIAFSSLSTLFSLVYGN